MTLSTVKTPSVLVLTTGGTIASRPHPGGEVRACISGADLVTTITVGQEVDVEVREVMRGHSFNLTRGDVLRLARQILFELEASPGAGLVVTHGTDTMEESAYLVDLVLGDGHCVVFTGAQRHAGEPDTDGPRNLADAIRVAAHPAARGLGAVVVMAGRIHPARGVFKAHTQALDAVDSPAPLGDVTGGRVHLRARPVRPPGFRLAELGTLSARVDVVPVYLDSDGVQLAACRAAGARGIVLQALGTGNPTPGVLREVRRCVADGLVVLVSTRCPAGPTAPVYGAGGGADLAAAGAVFAGGLRPSQARLLLAAALSAESDPRRALERLRPHLDG